MDFIGLFLRHHFAGKPVVASQNVRSFLRPVDAPLAAAGGTSLVFSCLCLLLAFDILCKEDMSVVLSAATFHSFSSFIVMVQGMST